MIGIIIGAALTLGILKYGRHRRYGRHRGWGGDSDCGPRRGWEREPWGPGRRGNHRARAWIRGLADRLDATREQERVMYDAAEELYSELRELGQRARDTKDELGQAFGPDRLDEERMGSLFAAHDELLEHARKAFVGALAKVHEVLDVEQRERLARLLARRRGYGPYRV